MNNKTLISAIVIFFLDQATKQIVLQFVPLNATISVLSFLSLTHIKNTGSLFGLFHTLNFNAFFILLSVVLIGWIVYNARKSCWSVREQIAWGLVVGGAAGNLLDRVLYGAVTDFIDVGFWPVFNVADTSITLGVLLLLVHELLRR